MRPAMPPWLGRALAKLDGLKPRERAMVFAAVAALLWAGYDAALLTPQQSRLKQARQQLTEAQTRTNAMTAEQARLAALPDPDEALRRRIAQAEATLRQRLAGNAALAQGLVAPEAMPALLEGLLRRAPGLKVVGLKTLAPEPLGAANPAQGQAAALYRHGVELTLEGGYADLVAYMAGLEAAPQRLYWGAAVLDAGQHPRLRLTLTLHTLSLDTAWLSL